MNKKLQIGVAEWKSRTKFLWISKSRGHRRHAGNDAGQLNASSIQQVTLDQGLGSSVILWSAWSCWLRWFWSAWAAISSARIRAKGKWRLPQVSWFPFFSAVVHWIFKMCWKSILSFAPTLWGERMNDDTPVIIARNPGPERQLCGKAVRVPCEGK